MKKKLIPKLVDENFLVRLLDPKCIDDRTLGILRLEDLLLVVLVGEDQEVEHR